MSYTPTEWKAGDVVTAEKLNHMEDGILESESLPELFFVRAHVEYLDEPDENGNYKAYHLDGVEYQDIRDAISEGKVPILRMDLGSDGYFFALFYSMDDSGGINFRHFLEPGSEEWFIIYFDGEGNTVFARNEYGLRNPVKMVPFDASIVRKQDLVNGGTFSVSNEELRQITSLMTSSMLGIEIFDTSGMVHLPTKFYFVSAQYVYESPDHAHKKYTFTNGFEIIDIEDNASGGGGTATYYDNMSRTVGGGVI